MNILTSDLSFRSTPHHRVYAWVAETAKVNYNTGIQRVARGINRALSDLGCEIIPVKSDASGQIVLPLSDEEVDSFARWSGPKTGHYSSLPPPREGDVFLVPELMVPPLPLDLGPFLWAKQRGMTTAAVFFDMIPLYQRDQYPSDFIEPLISFWRSFKDADIVFPISVTAENDFRQFAHYQGFSCDAASSEMIVKAVPLPGEIPEVPRCKEPRSGPQDGPLNLLAIGTWEPRKNYPRVIRAVGHARKQGVDVRLTIVGRKTTGIYDALEQEILACAAEVGEAVSLLSFVPDEELEIIKREAHATIFGSWMEGFGLPILESLWNGLPCICHNDSAMAEVAPGGGTIMVNVLDEEAIAAAIARLNNPRIYKRLATQAVRRDIKTWRDYGEEILYSLPVHSPFQRLEYNPFGW